MTDTRHTKFHIVRGLLFLLLTFTYMLVFFHRMAPGAIAGDLMEVFQISGAELGSLAATYFLVYSIMQIPSGVLADTLGMRYSMILGNLAAGAGSLLFGFAQSYAMAGAGRLLVGLGVSVIFISILKFNSIWFSSRHFALLAGLVGLIGNMGAVLSAGPLTHILQTFSWRTVFIAIGFLTLLLSVISIIFVRNNPRDYGFPELISTDSRHRAEESHHWLTELITVLKNRKIWPGFWSNFGVIGSAYAFMGLWGIPYLSDGHGMTRGEASSYITVMLFASAFGALFFGWLSNRMGRRKPVLIASNIVYTALLTLIVFVNLQAGLLSYVMFALLGFFCTGSVLTLTCAKEVAHPSRAGTATSIVNTGTFAGVLLLQPLFGWLLDHVWDGAVLNGVRVYQLSNYRHAMLLFILFAFIGIVGALCTKETYCRHI